MAGHYQPFVDDEAGPALANSFIKLNKVSDVHIIFHLFFVYLFD